MMKISELRIKYNPLREEYDGLAELKSDVEGEETNCLIQLSDKQCQDILSDGSYKLRGFFNAAAEMSWKSSETVFSKPISEEIPVPEVVAAPPTTEQGTDNVQKADDDLPL